MEGFKVESYLKPMLCGTADVVPTGADWILEPKLDGWRAITHRFGGLKLFARSGASYSGQLPYIEEELLACLPDDTALDGELIGKNWGDVQGVMTRGGAHVPSAAVPALSYVVFDITRCNGQDLRRLTWEQRRELLEQIQFGSYCYPNAVLPCTQEAHDKLIARGLEGTVAKRRTSKYANGRSQSWVKIKPQATAEAKVVGFKDGTGELAGLVGAFRVEMLDTGAETTVKCGTRERHKDATDNPDRWLGQIVEIKHHGIGATGKPRHPQFHRRRDDRQETAREAQIRRMLAAEKQPKGKREREPAGPRMRNYKAMTAEKLERVIRELKSHGDAYDRCMNGGSGEPARDLAVCEQIAEERGLVIV